MEAAPTPTSPLEPGIYHDLPAEDYFRDPAISRSLLWTVHDKSLAHARHYLDTRSARPTAAMHRGTLLHMAILEPEKFATTVIPGPTNPKTGKEYGYDTKAWLEAEEEATAQGKIMMGSEQRVRIEAMAHGVRANPDVQHMILAQDARETVLVWDDPITGIRCKARVDLGCFGLFAFIADIKTSIHAINAEKFSWSIRDLGYHFQAAFYRDGWAALSQRPGPYILVVTEPEPPHATEVYQIEQAAIDIGRMDYRDALSRLARALKTGEWPATTPSADIKQIGLPEAEYRRRAAEAQLQ